MGPSSTSAAAHDPGPVNVKAVNYASHSQESSAVIMLKPLSTVTTKRKRSIVPKLSNEVESQRMTHIAVERNRRKQMNEHLAALRALMPGSYVQKVMFLIEILSNCTSSSISSLHPYFESWFLSRYRIICMDNTGVLRVSSYFILNCMLQWYLIIDQRTLLDVQGDQASIVGGAIEFVKELEHLLHCLQSQKRRRAYSELSSGGTPTSRLAMPNPEPQFCQLQPPISFHNPHQVPSLTFCSKYPRFPLKRTITTRKGLLVDTFRCAHRSHTSCTMTGRHRTN